MEERMDLAYRVLDDQIVDVEGRRCGRVDDVELDGELGGDLYVAALLTGRGAYAQRLPARLRSLARRVFGDDVRGKLTHAIPWTRVEDVTSRVALYVRAEELDLAAADRAMSPWFDRLPGS